jgi:hypothetical protein
MLDRPIADVSLLGSDQKLAWKQTDDALVIPAPASAPSPEALVYKVVLKG